MISIIIKMIKVNLNEPVIFLNKTENLFIDNSKLSDIVKHEAGQVDFTTKKFPDSRPLREALALFHGVDPNWVNVGVGSSQVLDCIICRFSDHILLDIVPNFPLARNTASRLGITYVKAEVRESHELIPRVKELRLSDKTIAILSSPRNPYGYCFSIQQVIELLEHINGPVIIDEAYVDFSSQRLIPLLEKYSNLILVRTFSKAWGLSNLRIGYSLSQIGPGFIESFLLPHNIGELNQRVACRLLESPEIVRDSIQQMLNAKKKLTEELGKISFFRTWESETNFICIEDSSSEEIRAKLALNNIIVSGLHGILNYPAPWTQGMRIAVPPTHIINQLIKCIWPDGHD